MNSSLLPWKKLNRIKEMEYVAFKMTYTKPFTGTRLAFYAVKLNDSYRAVYSNSIEIKKLPMEFINSTQKIK